jgi:hypothetical protein
VTESTGNGGDVAARRVPLNVGHTVVLSRVHELKVGHELLLALLGLVLGLLEAEIPEVEVEGLLRLQSSDNNETTPGGPVDGVAVLLVDCADVTEVTGGTALELLRGEEGNSGLGGNGSLDDNLAGCDEHEAVALGFPGKVDNGILDGVDNLDGDALLTNAEDLQVGGKRLLGLGVAVDLDADVGGLGLPVQLAVGDVEEVTGTDDLLGGDGHQTNLGGVAAELGSPVAEELLVRLDALTLGCSGGPLEVDDTLNLDGRLVQQVHPGQLVDGDGLTLSQTGDVVVVGRPLECGPHHLLLNGVAILVGAAGHVDGGEGSERLAGCDVPDDVVLAIVLQRERGDRVVLVDLQRAVGPGGEVLLAGRVVDQVDAGMREALLPAPALSTPQLNTLGVDRGKEGSARRPLNERLCPVLAVHNNLRRILLVVPENANLLTTVHGDLVTAVGLGQPPAQVLGLLKGRNLGCVVLLVDASLLAEAVNVGQLVDSHGVLLVEGGSVELLDGGNGLGGSAVLNKGIARLQLVWKRRIAACSLRAQTPTYPSVFPLSLTGM